MKYLTVGELIEELKKHDPTLPAVIAHEGKGHQYGVTDQGIYKTNYGYFGNDSGASKVFGDSEEFLNIASM